MVRSGFAASKNKKDTAHTMRSEIQLIVDEIKQAISLLRRHL